jgi:hypothetical protein
VGEIRAAYGRLFLTWIAVRNEWGRGREGEGEKEQRHGDAGKVKE